jgi:hypothetical protein
MEKISKSITFDEATKSVTAIILCISNIPLPELLDNMKNIAAKVFEPLRKALGEKPIPVTSFYRSPALNKKIGGATNSQHTTGEAMDIDADGTHTTNREVFDWIKNNCEFDQLIFEFRKNRHDCEWVHVSLKKENNRKQILEAYKEGGKTKYKKYENTI